MQSLKQLPLRFSDEEQLEDFLSTPTAQLVNYLKTVSGDLIFLGANGKLGFGLARMARRALDKNGKNNKVIAVSRFTSQDDIKQFEEIGIQTIAGDLLDPDFYSKLPKVENVYFLAGRKFGTEGDEPMTWASNVYLPALVSEKFKKSNIVAFSTGCVYPLVDVTSGGSKETDKPEPEGEYAQSCLGRERMFEYISNKHRTPVVLIRLNYAVEMRYGVLVDLGLKVLHGEPINLSMGYFNVIWQGEMNDMVLRSLQFCESPVNIVNITGPQILSVRNIAEMFGKEFAKQPIFVENETETALLSNTDKALSLFGKPQVEISTIVKWTADWLANGLVILNKPTHFQVRDGKY